VTHNEDDLYRSAKCAGVYGLFVPSYAEKTDHDAITKAKDICWGRDGKPECTVRVACAITAIINSDWAGVHGGMVQRELLAFKRQLLEQGVKLRAPIKKLDIDQYVVQGNDEAGLPPADRPAAPRDDTPRRRATGEGRAAHPPKRDGKGRMVSS
jgi:tetrahydromethanopterin S-methyltransferase subunit D